MIESMQGHDKQVCASIKACSSDCVLQCWMSQTVEESWSATSLAVESVILTHK